VNTQVLPAAVKAFIGFALASLVCQFVKITLWWSASQELIELISKFQQPSTQAIGHAFRIVAFLCGVGLIYLIARWRSRLARLIYLMATAVVILSLVASFIASDVDIWGNKLGIAASALQVGAAFCLLTRGFRLWLRSPAVRVLSNIFS
jgi:hypothetical protein